MSSYTLRNHEGLTSIFKDGVFCSKILNFTFELKGFACLKMPKVRGHGNELKTYRVIYLHRPVDNVSGLATVEHSQCKNLEDFVKEINSQFKGAGFRVYGYSQRASELVEKYLEDTEEEKRMRNGYHEYKVSMSYGQLGEKMDVLHIDGRNAFHVETHESVTVASEYVFPTMPDPMNIGVDSLLRRPVAGDEDLAKSIHRRLFHAMQEAFPNNAIPCLGGQVSGYSANVWKATVGEIHVVPTFSINSFEPGAGKTTSVLNGVFTFDTKGSSSIYSAAKGTRPEFLYKNMAVRATFMPIDELKAKQKKEWLAFLTELANAFARGTVSHDAQVQVVGMVLACNVFFRKEDLDDADSEGVGRVFSRLLQIPLHARSVRMEDDPKFSLKMKIINNIHKELHTTALFVADLQRRYFLAITRNHESKPCDDSLYQRVSQKIGCAAQGQSLWPRSLSHLVNLTFFVLLYAEWVGLAIEDRVFEWAVCDMLPMININQPFKHDLPAQQDELPQFIHALLTHYLKNPAELVGCVIIYHPCCFSPWCFP
jgi:hypothetical protein